MRIILRLAIFLLFLFPSFSWAGNTTICTSGCDYTTLYNWEAGEDGTITAPAVGQITEGFLDTSAVVIDGFTGNSATNYIKVYTSAAARHSGKWDEGKYRLDFSDDWAYVINCHVNYVRIKGLQMHNSNAVGLCFNYDGAGELYFSYNILQSGPSTSDANSLYLDGMGASTVKIWNNIIYNVQQGIYFDWGTDGSTFIIYNNIFVDITSGGIHIDDDAAAQIAYIKNNLVFNTAEDYYLKAFTTCSYDHNMGEDDESGSQTNYVQTTQGGTDIFVNYNNDDFHIKSGSDAKDAGTDLSSDSNLAFSDDIDGDTRSGSWDIGADEYISAATAAQVIMMTW